MTKIFPPLASPISGELTINLGYSVVTALVMFTLLVKLVLVSLVCSNSLHSAMFSITKVNVLSILTATLPLITYASYPRAALVM